jgi:hypothetical protein
MLWNALVHHSIVPDMINEIISWFQQLPGRAMAAVNEMISHALGALGTMATSAMNAGAAIVNGIASGITGAIGAVTGAIGTVVSVIADHLPHSPAKRGPLSLLNEFGPALVNTFARDIRSNSPAARAAAEHIAAEVADALKNVQAEIKVARAHHEKGLLKELEAERRGDAAELKDLKGVVHADGFAWSNQNPNDPINFNAHHKGTAHHAGRASAASALATEYLKEIAANIARITSIVTNPATAGAALGSFSSAPGRYQFPTIGAGNVSVQVNPPPIYLDGRTLAFGLMPYITDAIRYAVGTHSM